MTRCPSELELERYLLEPERSTAAAHVASCARCRDAVAAMRAVGDEFRREVFPRTVDAVLARSRPRRARSRWVVAAAPLGLAAAAAAALMLFVVRPGSDYVGTKGADLGLAVFVAGDRGARAVRDGEPVPAGAAIRFQVRPAAACRLWIVSIDGAGQVSRLFPPSGDPLSLAAAATLPGGAVLDGRAGPERLFAVCARAPLDYAAVERAARAKAAGGDAAVRTTRGLAGLPPDTAQATVLLEKRR